MIRRSKVPEQEPHEPEEGAVEPANQVDHDLAVIYGRNDKQKTDLTKMEVRKKSPLTRFLIWLLITLAILSAAAWGGYLLFQHFAPHNTQSLNLTIDGPDTVVSGSSAEYDVNYQDAGDSPIASLSVKLNVPPGFKITSTSPTATGDGNVWTIGTVTAGSDGMIQVKGVWTDTVPSGSTVQGIATYRPANFNADFQQIAVKTVAVTSSVLTVTADAPATAVPGVSVNEVFHVKNTGTETLGPIELRLTLPNTFIVKASDPAATATNSWSFPSLDPNAEAVVTVSGSFAADATDLQTFTAAAGLDRDGIFLPQSSFDAQTNVVGGGLSLKLITNGSTDAQSVSVGDTLHTSIVVSNSGDKEMDGLTVQLSADAGGSKLPIDWSKATLSGGSQSDSTVSWASKSLSKAGILAPGSDETIDLTIPLLSSLGTSSDQFKLTVTATVAQIGSTTVTKTVQSSPQTISVNSNTTITAKGLYYQDSTPVGTGPLPPKVGQTTSYRVYWTVTNSLHALNQVSVSATLPPNVTFVAQKQIDIGTLTFDTPTRTLTWTIDRLPTTVPSATTAFDLSVTPTADDVGKFMKLINESDLTATDSKTNTIIQKSSDAITTELPDDSEAAGKGSVSL